MKARMTAALALALLGAGATQAQAAYTGSVRNGTLEITGDSASDRLLMSLRPGAPSILDLDVGVDGTADLSFDRMLFGAIVVNAAGGDDEVRVLHVGQFGDEAITVDGGSGADTLTGGVGNETLRGGSGDDAVTGGDGNDVVSLGSGNDRVDWNPGDDDDTIEGGSGADVLEFNGSATLERIDVEAAGARVRLTRDIANVVTDFDGVERVALATRGSSDMVGVFPLAGTDLRSVDVDLGLDGAPDNVVVIGTAGADRLHAGGDGTAVVADGVGAATRVTGGEAADVLTLRGLAGADEIVGGPDMTGPMWVRGVGDEDVDTAVYEGTPGSDDIGVAAGAGEPVVGTGSAAPFGVMTEELAVRGGNGGDTIGGAGNLAVLGTHVTMDGGAGDDVLRSGNGADLLLGGSGDDTVDGNQGTDTARLGSGDDQYWWDPGDGSDAVEGEGGTDAFESNGSSAGETVSFSAVGGDARFQRNIGTVTVDLDDVERMGYRARGGDDTVTVEDLSGTDVDVAFLDLQGLAAGGDGARDAVIVRGTDRADRVRLARFEDQLRVTGPPAATWILGAEAANDTLRLETRGGDDSVTLDSGLDRIATQFDLGADD